MNTMLPNATQPARHFTLSLQQLLLNDAALTCRRLGTSAVRRIIPTDAVAISVNFQNVFWPVRIVLRRRQPN